MEGVRSDHTGISARITLENPPENRLYPAMLEALVAALEDANADPEVKAVVLTGAGAVFCGGVDGQRLAQGDPSAFATTLVKLFKLIPTLGVPVIAAVNGDALMSGFSLVCAADIAIGVEGARLGTIEASLGLWPTIAQVPVLHRLLPGHALANILTGEPFSAQRAYEVGALTKVVAATELEAEVDHWLALSTRSKALARGRQSAHRLLSLPYAQALDASFEEFTNLFATARPA